MLEALGMEPDVELVYRALLSRPAATAEEIATGVDRPDDVVEEALAVLVESGLAHRTDSGEHVAAPPAVALGALITERRDGLRLAEQAMAGLAEEHRAALAGRDIGQLVEVVTGSESVRHRFQQVQQAATRELRMFTTAPFVVVPMGENTAETAATDRGVTVRVLLERAVLEEPSATEEVVDSLRSGVQIRVVETLPVKLVLADTDLALVSLVVGSGGDPGAVLLHRSGLVDVLDALFETVWSRAYALTPTNVGATIGDGAVAGPTAQERQVLGLMLAGLSDQAVATQLGLSLRTVQRVLRRLEDLAEVDSRLQLGWHAAHHGWA